MRQHRVRTLLSICTTASLDSGIKVEDYRGCRPVRFIRSLFHSGSSPCCHFFSLMSLFEPFGGENTDKASPSCLPNQTTQFRRKLAGCHDILMLCPPATGILVNRRVQSRLSGNHKLVILRVSRGFLTAIR